MIYNYHSYCLLCQRFLHFVLDNFTTKELQALSKGVLDNLKNSNDKTLQRVASILERRLKAYKKLGQGLNTKVGQQEFFTSLSDALRNIEAEQLALAPVAVRALRKIKTKKIILDPVMVAKG